MVRYAEKDSYYGDSSINSSEEGSMGVDDYLDEALDEDGDNDIQSNDDDDDEHNDSKASRSVGVKQQSVINTNCEYH